MKFSGIMIGTENPQRLKDYYSKLFGKPTWDDGEGGYFGWQFGDAGVMIGPHSEVKGKNREPGRILWNIETPDVKGEFAKLKAAGATVVKEPYDPGEDSGMTITTFSDPDGNYFQLMSPMDEAAFERAKETLAKR
ncbi:MAG TPA: VOC family protein [Candidatus Limnocylindria bacterium]|nr:VOC family protein [Candidatus Limnocylindria bacterium]